MADSKKDRVLYKICRALVTMRANKGVKESLSILGNELKCAGAFVLQSNEIPFLFEMKNLWEPKKRIAGKKLLLDYSGAPEWNILNPFIEDVDGHKYCKVNDTADWECGRITRDFVDTLGIGSLFFSVMKEGNEFLGIIVMFHTEAHEWSETEIALIREASDLIAHEITDIKRDESRDYLIQESDRIIKEANDAKSRFMTNLSHEIRTPVNALVGMTSIMRHNVDSPETISECVDRMQKLTGQLMEIINDCVDMTLINSNEMTMSISWVPIESIITGVRRVIEPLTEGRHQHLELEYDETLSVFGDEVKMGRILINALSNSCRNAEEGTNIFLSIKEEQYASGRTGVTIRIHDEVAGLDGEVAKHIFEPFGGERFHDMFKGTGLSMTVTKHLVDIMNGTIDYYSDGWGTELVITLPFETKGSTRTEKTEKKLESEVAEMYIGRRVLIAEDNVLMGEILATILGYRGLESDLVLNGQEAFDQYSAHDPFFYDLVLMDIQMPVMDGLEASRAIRSSGRADAAIIPIVAVSANEFTQDIEKAKLAGMNSYLNKPVSEKELLETISTYVL